MVSFAEKLRGITGFTNSKRKQYGKRNNRSLLRKRQGKTTLAIGQAALCRTGKKCDHHSVSEGQGTARTGFLEELDNLDFKIFRFEKMDTCYNDLSEQEKTEERTNILNGLNFARKVIATQECDFLLLDEILGTSG